ncbi:MAG: NAD(P)-dependent oxidoreductase [Chloroflexi bacterium]|nr:NAD(P)-dependent oxidoreductase [Chloroflexota bacterium]
MANDRAASESSEPLRPLEASAPAAPAAQPERPEVDRKARLKLPANRPEKQPAETRVHNWDEVYHLFDPETAKAEAVRCIQCPAAPCQVACPVHNDIPGSLWLLEQGDFDGAANIFRETSELPEMCGRLCPQERLCEGDCVVGKKGIPVAIGKLESFVTEHQRAHGTPPQTTAAAPTGKRVAVIGAGPAGIGVAERLARAGHGVVIYDAWPVPGALLHYGIPKFKQNKASVARKFDDLRALGVELVMSTRIGQDIPFAQLERDYDAVFVGAGAIDGSQLGFEHQDAPGVYQATEFLVRGNLPPEDLPEALREPLPALRRVVVIGGGDTSMDCVRTAVRLGAEQVRLVYRRTEAEMQGRAEERHHAHEEGVIFEYVTSPLAILVDDAGALSGVRCQRMQLGESDESGRARPEPVPGSEFEIAADALVVAIGYNVDDEWGEVAPAVTRDSWGRFAVDPETMRTSRRGVFAGGDDVNGAELVVTALADAHVAAASIEEYLASGEW